MCGSVKHLFILIIAAFAALINPPRAVGGVLNLTLREAVEIALSDNPTVIIAQTEVLRYDYVRRTTSGALLPQVEASAGLDRTLQSQNFARGFSFGSEQYNTLAATATISLAIYAPTIYRTLKMNQAETLAAVEQARASRIEMIAQVKIAYYNILLAQHALDVLQQSAQTAQQTVDETSVKFNSGIASEYDLLTAQVQLSNLKPTILEAQTAIVIAKDILKMYLSLGNDVEITLDSDIEKMREEALAGYSNTSLLSLDYYGNSTLRSLAISQQVLEEQLRVNNATRLPSLAAYGQISYTGNNMESYTTTTPPSSEYYWQHPASVGLTLSVPIFSGLTNSSRSRQIENQIAQLQLQRRYAEQGVNVDVSTAINNIATSRERYLVERVTVQQAQKAYDISKTRYDAGAGTILELNTSRLALTQSELNLSQALFDLMSAKCEYDRVMGFEIIE